VKTERKISKTPKILGRAKGLVRDLIVTRTGETITLWSEAGVRHTVFDRRTPHLPGLEYARNTLAAMAFCSSARSCLVLGLGGGSIPRMLVAACPTMEVTVVEIDPAIVDLAARHFHVDALPRCVVLREDAADYVKRRESRFGIVIVDTYFDDRFPGQCMTREFIENAGACLHDGGVLVINWLTGYPELTRKMVRYLKSLFVQVWQLPGRTSRNTVYFATAGPLTHSAIVGTAVDIEAKLPFACSLRQLVGRLRLLE
jgi:spermidine synthase